MFIKIFKAGLRLSEDAFDLLKIIEIASE